MKLSERIERTIASVEPIDRELESKALLRHDTLTKPPGSLGRLETIAARLCGIQRRERPVSEGRRIVIFAADHGIVEEGVSAYPSDVTGQMVANFASGGAGINALARAASTEVTVVDVGVAKPVPASQGGHAEIVSRPVRRGTRNFAREAAMTASELAEAMEVGLDEAERANADGVRLVGLGEMGIGNTTAASAMTTALTGIPVEEATGRGAGLDDEGLVRKAAVIRAALETHGVGSDDPAEVLRVVGGLEIAALSGFVIGAAAAQLAVLVDGFITTAAFAAAARLCPRLGDYAFFAHRSPEPGHTAPSRIARRPTASRPSDATRGGEWSGGRDACPGCSGCRLQRNGDLRVRRRVETVSRFLTALAFLTRIPVRQPFSGEEVGQSTAWFPLVGALLGVAQASIALAATHRWIPPPLAAILMVAASAWLTRGLHLDGLADFVDGLGGGRDRESDLRIMRDPAVGTFGAVALILLLLLKVAALHEILVRGQPGVILLAPVFARWSVVLLSRSLPAARTEGLGASVSTSVGSAELAGATLAAQKRIDGASYNVVIGEARLLQMGRIALDHTARRVENDDGVDGIDEDFAVELEAFLRLLARRDVDDTPQDDTFSAQLGDAEREKGPYRAAVVPAHPHFHVLDESVLAQSLQYLLALGGVVVELRCVPSLERLGRSADELSKRAVGVEDAAFLHRAHDEGNGGTLDDAGELLIRLSFPALQSEVLQSMTDRDLDLARWRRPPRESTGVR